MAAFALSNQIASRLSQEFTQQTVKLRGHSSCRRFGFTQRRDLKIERGGVSIWMIIRKKIESHRR